MDEALYKTNIGNETSQLPRMLDIEIWFGKAQYQEKEVVPKVSSPHLCFNRANEVLLAPIMLYISSLGYPVSQSAVEYYSEVAELFVRCGNDPLSWDIAVPLYELAGGRPVIPVSYPNPQTTQKQVENSDSEAAKSCQAKKRKIGYIIDKVMEWRALHDGDEDGDMKMTLEQAATYVTIAKKSLDDYLLQLRLDLYSLGYKYGFNFQEHRDDGIGVLRAYVKKWKYVETLLEKPKRNREEFALLKEADLIGNDHCTRRNCCIIPTNLQERLSQVLHHSNT